MDLTSGNTVVDLNDTTDTIFDCLNDTKETIFGDETWSHCSSDTLEEQSDKVEDVAEVIPGDKNLSLSSGLLKEDQLFLHLPLTSGLNSEDTDTSRPVHVSGNQTRSPLQKSLKASSEKKFATFCDEMSFTDSLQMDLTLEEDISNITKVRSESEIQEEEDQLFLYLSPSSDSGSDFEDAGNQSFGSTSSSRPRGTTCGLENEKSVPRKQTRKIFKEMSTDYNKILQLPCCANDCLKQLSVVDISTCHEHMKQKGERQQKQFILDTLRTQGSLINRKKTVDFQCKLLIYGKNFCPKGWCIAYNVSDWRYRDCIRFLKAGKTQIVHGNTRLRGSRKKVKTTTALAWMSCLFKRVGDYMPHKDVIHLPHTWTKKNLYERMTREQTQRGLLKTDIVSYEHFTRIWKQNLQQYIISKTSCFTKCSTCTQLDEQYDQAVSNDVRKKIANLRQTHDQKVELERKAYHDAREIARREPTEMTCIILDGMDQSKTNVPHFIIQDKDNTHLAQLPIHYTGVLIHTGTSEGRIPLIFYDVKHIPHDSNLTIHCLVQALLTAKAHLGKVLFLQLDNCFRENKNKYVLSFAALMVELKIFKEVYVHFLPVGHTHEDVDQMFSCVSRHLRHHNAYTLPDLLSETSASYYPPVSMLPVKMVQNAKAVLTDIMVGSFGNHSKPLWFRFRNTDGKCYMHYKLWTSDPWKPSSESNLPHGLLCLKTLPDMTRDLEFVEPSLEKTDYDKLAKELPHAYSSRLPMQAKEWWNQFIGVQMKKDYEVVPPRRLWTLKELIHKDTEESTPAEEEEEEALLSLKARIETECPDVYIGSQGKTKKNSVTHVENFSTVLPGVLVAVHCEETEGRPFLGTIVERIDDDTVMVAWLRGTWKGIWREWMVKNGKTCYRYKSVVPLRSLILWDFSLTLKGRLRSSTSDELRMKYDELDSL